MFYGLPYKGSKNFIAKWLIDQLPKAETFVDLFGGGGAVTHAALLSGKYKHFIINDIDPAMPKLFVESIQGKHKLTDHLQWIDRETFHTAKANDPLLAMCWSFCTNFIDYLYGRNIEEMKADYHRAVVYGETERLTKYGYNATLSDSPDIMARYADIRRQLKDDNRLDHLSRYDRIEKLYTTQINAANIETYGVNYVDVPIPQDAVIYCDIPYIGTNCGKYYVKEIFSHSDFYRWALQQDNIFISEYRMPEEFIPAAQIQKTVTSGRNGTAGYIDEIIFTNAQTFNAYDYLQKGEQLTLW